MRESLLVEFKNNDDNSLICPIPMDDKDLVGISVDKIKEVIEKIDQIYDELKS